MNEWKAMFYEECRLLHSHRRVNFRSDIALTGWTL
jgi:hypothetical protein